MCQRDHEDNKSIISGGREAERASQQRTLCNCCPGPRWLDPYPRTIPDGLSFSFSLSLVVVVVVVIVLMASFVVTIAVVLQATTFITKFYKRLKYNPRETRG